MKWKMHRLSVEEIIKTIRARKPLSAVADTYGFTLEIREYAPYVCGAVHDGHHFRQSLWENCTHTAYERWYEEDPCTKAMVAEHPIVIAGMDSRYEYDLNRPPQSAIYDDAWGKPLWHAPLSEHEKAISLAKHGDFYRVVDALMETLEAIHGKVLVIDMHSYNWQRWDREVPTWNLGTANVDENRYGKVINSWREKLSGIHLPHNLPRTAKINDTFQGNGYFLKHITANFRNTLVLATEIAKIYCDENTGIIYPEVVRAVASQFTELIPLQTAEFNRLAL